MGQAASTWRRRRDDMADEVRTFTDTLEKDDPSLSGLDALLVDNLFEPCYIEVLQAQYKAVREASDLAKLIAVAIGATLDDLRVLLADFDGPDAAAALAARQRVTQEFYLTSEAFHRLMTIIGGSISEDEWGEVDGILARATLLASLMGLAHEQEQGNSISARLEQFGLTSVSFARLHCLRSLLAGGATILPTECEEIYSILVQIKKQRRYADQRQAEQKRNISLSPDIFQFPEPPPLVFPPPEPAPLPVWRATTRDLRNWEVTLQSRIEQERTVTDALRQAVSAVEEETLPRLRDVLIMATGFEGSNLTTKAKRATDALLIDAQAGGCQLTTRIGQAIETTQGLLWSLRTGLLQDTYPDLTLEADYFDEEWQWIGSYATWRAAMFVFLYPENILLPTLRRKQTPAFCQLVDTLRTNRLLTPEGARQAANGYADYFEDVCKLSVQATCQAWTRIRERESCRMLPLSERRDLFHMFAIGGKTHKVYSSTYDPHGDPDFPQTFWEVVPGLENLSVTKIAGAVPYDRSSEERFIFLFMLANEELETKLVYTKYNLERGNWDGEQELDLPPHVGALTAVAVQSSYNDVPKLAFYTSYPHPGQAPVLMFAH